MSRRAAKSSGVEPDEPMEQKTGTKALVDGLPPPNMARDEEPCKASKFAHLMQVG